MSTVTEEKQVSRDAAHKKHSEKMVPETNQIDGFDCKNVQFDKLYEDVFDKEDVHYNSDRPVQLQAVLYMRGSQKHAEAEQKHNFGHASGCVLQQKKRQFHPTGKIGAAVVNDDIHLYGEPDRLGCVNYTVLHAKSLLPEVTAGIITQRMAIYNSADGSYTRYKKINWQAQQALLAAQQVLEKEQPYEDKVKIRDIIGELDKLLIDTNITSVKDKLQAILDITKEPEITISEACSKADYAKYTSEQESTTYGIDGTASLEDTPDKIVGPSDYKMDALHLIALEAKKKVEAEPNVRVGPHIAISCVGKKIYAAINSYISLNGSEIRATTAQVQIGIKNAIQALATDTSPLAEELIDPPEVQVNLGLKDNERLSREKRHARLTHANRPTAAMVKTYIVRLNTLAQQPENIIVVDNTPADIGDYNTSLVPNAIANSQFSVHAEMLVAAAIKRDAAKVLANKASKVATIAENGHFATIRIGGTLIDCEDCYHKHHDSNTHTSDELNTLRKTDVLTKGKRIATTGYSHDHDFQENYQSKVMSSASHGESFRLWAHTDVVRISVDIKQCEDQIYSKYNSAKGKLEVFIKKFIGCENNIVPRSKLLDINKKSIETLDIAKIRSSITPRQILEDLPHNAALESTQYNAVDTAIFTKVLSDSQRVATLFLAVNALLPTIGDVIVYINADAPEEIPNTITDINAIAAIKRVYPPTRK